MSAQARPAALAEINVTPLVDVLLVLLIIFMLVVPLAPLGLDVGLPPAATSAESGPGPSLVLTIEPGGLALNREPVASLDALSGRLADLFATRGDRTLFVRADGVVPYGDVVAAMDVAKGAGADRIGIMTAR
jgi:biopolymer transport protein ExbD